VAAAASTVMGMGHDHLLPVRQALLAGEEGMPRCSE
jgi:hypothetical protein